MAYWYIEICDIFFVLSRSMPLKTLTCTMTHTHNGIGEEFVRAAESKIFCHYLWPVVSGLRLISIDIYLCILILKRKSENLIGVFFVIRVYGDDVNLTSCRQKESVLQVCFHLIKHVSLSSLRSTFFSNVWNWKVLFFLKESSSRVLTNVRHFPSF